jgi:large repetitive protein
MPFESVVCAGSMQSIDSRARRLSTWVRRGLMAMMVSVGMLSPGLVTAQTRLTVDDVSITEGNTGDTAAVFVVRLSAPAPAGGISFDFSTSDGTADANDYDSLPVYRGEISEGFTDTEIGVTIHGDLDIEPDETFYLDISNATGATIDDGQAVGTILADDRLPRLSVDDAVAAEGDPLHFIVRLDAGARAGGVSFDVSTSDIITALGDIDYEVVPTTRIAIAEGERQADVYVPALIDALTENEETFRLNFINVTGAEPGATHATGTITDTAVVRPSIDTDNAQVVEGNAGITLMHFTVRLSEPVAQTVSVDYSATGLEEVEGVAGRIIFRPGETLKAIAVPIVGDTLVELDEYFYVELSDAVNADIGANFAQGIIINDDAVIELDFRGAAIATVGTSYNAPIYTSGAKAPSHALTAGILPPGLLLRNWGGGVDIEGVPIESGIYRFTITVTDTTSPPGGPFSASAEFIITVSAPSIELPPTTFQTGFYGEDYAQRLTPASGGTAPYTYTLTGGTLPDGLSLGGDGEITGMPNESGSFDFTVTATDSSSSGPYSASRDYRLNIAALRLIPAGAGSVVSYASYYGVTFHVTGAPGPYLYAVTSGALPPGLSLVDHVLSGVPSVPGHYTFAITVQSTTVGSATVTENFTIDVTTTPFRFFPDAFPEYSVGGSYAGAFIINGGIAPITFELAGGALPTGMTLTAGGALSGTPTTAGTYAATIRATDANGLTGTRDYPFVVTRIPLQLPTTPLAEIRFNQFSYATITSANGGALPYAYVVTAGALPSGMTLTSDGTLRGIPAEAGNYEFEITVTDSDTVNGPSRATQSYRLVVLPPAITLEPLFDLVGDVNQSYGGAIAVRGAGTPPYAFTSTGTLPAGLSLTAAGEITGVPTQEGSFDIAITATDSTPIVHATVIQHFTVRIGPLRLSFPTRTLRPAEVGTSYREIFAASDGETPYTYSVSAGALPQGLALQSEGTLAGVPMASGVFRFKITAKDASAGVEGTATTAFVLNVAPALVFPAPIMLSVEDAFVYEGDSGSSMLRFKLRLDRAPPIGGVSFDVFTSEGTAGGNDYAAVPAHREVIPEGRREIYVDVIVNGDRDEEEDETLFLHLSNVTGATLVDDEAAGTILNDDRPLNILLPEHAFVEGGYSLYTIVLDDEAGPEGVTFDVNTSDGTAMAGMDYEGVFSRRFFIPPGQRAVSIYFNIVSDDIDESDEYFMLEVSSVVGASPVVSKGKITITSRAATLPKLIAEGWATVEGDSGKKIMQFRVGLSEASTKAVMVEYGLNSSEYDHPERNQYGTLVFHPGEMEKTIPYAVDGDPFPEVDGNVTLVLQNAVNAEIADVLVTGTIYDDDNPLDFNLRNLNEARLSEPYFEQISVDGWRRPYTYSILSGALPVGLTLGRQTGWISGTPVEAGIFYITISVTDSSPGPVGPYTISRQYVLRVQPDVVTLPETPLPDATQGMPYAVTLNAATGGELPYRYGTSSNLPPGLSMSGDRLISGTPTQPGTYYITVKATDSSAFPGPYDATRTYRLVVYPPGLRLPYSVPSYGYVGQSYNGTMMPGGSVAPYALKIASGALPNGLTMDEAGAITGIPTHAGNFVFSIMVTDSASPSPQSLTVNLSLRIFAPNLVVTSSNPSNTAEYDAAYTQTFTASGGIGPYVYGIEGDLPQGMSFSSNTLSGTSRASGTYYLTLITTDTGAHGEGAPFSSRRYLSFVVGESPVIIAPTESVLPNGRILEPYSQAFTASGGEAPYRFEAVDLSVIPEGITLSEDGVLSGTTIRSGVFPLTLLCTDANGVTSKKRYSFGIQTANLTISPERLPNGATGVPYEQPITAGGGVAPYSFTVIGLPQGMDFDWTDNTIRGTPTEAGVFAVIVYVRDSAQGSVSTSSVEYTLEIASADLVLGPSELSLASVGVPYQTVFSVSGGVAPYHLSIPQEAIAPGLVFDVANSMITGTPTEAGTYTFSLTATDSSIGPGGANAVTGAYTLTVASPIAAPVITITPEILPGGVRMLAYDQTLTATGGTAPYVFTVTAGTLPPGLNIGIAGAITGTPATIGSSTFTVTATDASGFTATATYTVAVTEAPPEAVSRTMHAVAGQALAVDLTEGASGGPFTAAALVSLTPANAGTATVAQVGSGAIARYTLTYTPATTFAGISTATFTLDNASGTSQPATITFDVTPRPDPSQDPEVRGLLNAQVESTRRFATTQIDNFQQRLERMHGAGEENGYRNGLNVTYTQYCPQVVGTIPGRRCERPAVAGAEQPRDATATSRSKDGNAAFGVWSGGVIRSGNHDGRNGSATVSFETDGVSVGADYRVNDAFAFGAGFGYGRDDSDIGDLGSRSEADALTLALYASYSPGQRFFLDGLLGYQRLAYDLRRFVSETGATVDGRRDGTQWFASVSMGADLQKGHWRVTPYTRLDAAEAMLDRYIEIGDPVYALAYGDLDTDAVTGNAGLRVDYRRQAHWGVWSPQLRLEYQHDFRGNGTQALGYADLPAGPFYRTDSSDFDRTRLMLGLGVLFDRDNDWSFKVDYRGLIGSGGDRDHGLQINIDRKF